MPDISLIPACMFGEFKVRQIEGMLQWVTFLSKRGQAIPRDCQWWLPEFSPHWARKHTFRNCMGYFIRIVENPTDTPEAQ